MKQLSHVALLFPLTLLLLNTVHPQEARPIPPGIRQADKAAEQAERNIPPPAARRATLDSGKLKREADELAALAQSVPRDVDQTSKGALPKDLGEKLRKIEKIAKQLRNGLSL